MKRIPPFLLSMVLGIAAPLVGAPASGDAQPMVVPVPVNPKATPAARAVLEFIAGLEQRGEGRILSGQFTGFEGQQGSHLPAAIAKATGQWPAMVGVDYADFAHNTISHKRQNKVALDYWRNGGLVTVSAHLWNPSRTDPNTFGLRDKGIKLDELLQTGSPVNKAWMRQLDQVADGLEALRKKGVVVLWRPFHEMNGGWFWWGAQEPAAFRRVWRHMFEYFSKDRGLDNLLWVFSPNHGDNAADYYPGDDLVDMAGLDAYTDHVNPDGVRGYPAMARIPKPFGFTEYGPHGAANPPGDYDYRRFLLGIQTHFQRTTFFLCWDEKWSPANNHHAKELFNDPAVLNRSGLPASWVD